MLHISPFFNRSRIVTVMLHNAECLSVLIQSFSFKLKCDRVHYCKYSIHLFSLLSDFLHFKLIFSILLTISIIKFISIFKSSSASSEKILFFVFSYEMKKSQRIIFHCIVTTFVELNRSIHLRKF